MNELDKAVLKPENSLDIIKCEKYNNAIYTVYKIKNIQTTQITINLECE